MKQRIKKQPNYFGLIAACLALVGQAGAQVIYNNDFQTPVGSEWSVTGRDTTPAGSRTFLGQFGNNTASLTLGGLVPHNSLTLSFDLFVIRSWDGNSSISGAGPDIFTLGVSGGDFVADHLQQQRELTWVLAPVFS